MAKFSRGVDEAEPNFCPDSDLNPNLSIDSPAHWSLDSVWPVSIKAEFARGPPGTPGIIINCCLASDHFVAIYHQHITPILLAL